MKNLKMLIACLMAMAMILALAACGSSATPAQSQEQTAAEEPAPSEEPAPAEESTEEAATEAEQPVEETAAVVTLTGTGETLGMDGETMQPTAATLVLDFTTDKATLELTTNTMDMDFYLLASEASEDPNMAMLYMMCSVIGEGEIEELDGGCTVTFAWNMDVVDEATGATSTVPMTLEIPVMFTQSGYSATIDYAGIVVEVSSAS